jgi:hypothetical protein
LLRTARGGPNAAKLKFFSAKTLNALLLDQRFAHR